MNARWVATIHAGARVAAARASVAGRRRAKSSRRKTSRAIAFEARIAPTAFHPKRDTTSAVPQPHGRATIRTGGAAKWVRVPPADTLTNRRPRVAYASQREGPRLKN